MFPRRLSSPVRATEPLPSQLCRGWVNFNGTGTAAILGSYNVSSLTDNGTGDFTVTWTQAFAAASSYAVTAIGRLDATTGGDAIAISSAAAPTTTSVRTVHYDVGGTLGDPAVVCLAAWGR